jgi:hypothetical protein
MTSEAPRFDPVLSRTIRSRTRSTRRTEASKVAQALRTENRPMTEVRVAEEMTLRGETAGYGGVPVRAVVPGQALTSIERGDLPVETRMKIRVPGYGWRAVGVRVSPGDDEGVAGEKGPVRLTVPGYGRAPLRMSFLGRKR